ncbi:hypothetical protein BY458DRAFT_444177 [Sporodiniella umbellata]|nr:hypothetical protein BY458DRAFT_444177 [Sporodiniella umbellata]
MKEVRAQKILSPDAIHNLFGNLNTLVDFQRRFLVQIEAQAACSPQRQRFGFLFIQYEPAFIVYEPFCANFKTAQDLVVQETQKLKKLSQIMSPEYELPAMLIKPIQRVCKYPLLLQQLIKSTPEEWAYFEENKEGLEAIQRVTTRVNETKRVQENALMLKEIKTKVYTEDGNENLLDKFGTLLLHDKFVLQKKESDHAKERVVFLFQKAILLFKEVKDTNKNTISIKKKKKDGTLMVRGRIPMSGIDHVKGFVNQAGNHILAVTWKEKDVSQTIHLNCRNEELVRQWIRTIVEIKEPVARPENLPATPQTMTSETYTMSDCYGDNDWDYYSSYNLDEEASACTFESSPSPYESRSNSTQYHSELSELARRDSPGAYHSPRTLHNIPSSSYLQSLSEHPSPFPSPLTTEGFLQASLISSPPISHPSSPNNEILGALWQRRQQPRQPETAEWAYEEKNIHSRDMKTWSSYLNISSGTSNRRSSNQDTTEDRVKIRIHYQGSACAVVVPTDIDYRQLSVIIEDKVKRCIEETTFSLIRLQYEDENGDKVTIRSTLDVRMGLQIKGPNNIVDFHVNVYQ